MFISVPHAVAAVVLSCFEAALGIDDVGDRPNDTVVADAPDDDDAAASALRAALRFVPLIPFTVVSWPMVEHALDVERAASAFILPPHILPIIDHSDDPMATRPHGARAGPADDVEAATP